MSRDNSTLFVANSGDDAIGLYSIDDGKLVSSLHTGSSPGGMAFSADEHLLLALDTRSGDVSVIRTQSRLGPSLFTILPAGGGPVAIVTKVVGRGEGLAAGRKAGPPALRKDDKSGGDLKPDGRGRG